MLINGYLSLYRKVREVHSGRTLFTVHRTLYLVMHISELLTPLFIIWKVNPNHITYARFFVGLLGLILLPYVSPNYVFVPIVLWMVCYLFDCVDGDVARTTEKSSMLGRYVDGMVDIFMQSLLFLVYGIALFKYEQNLFYVWFGSVTCFLFAVGNLNIDRYAGYRRWILQDQGQDIGDFRLSRGGRHLVNLLMDVFFISMFVSIFDFKAGALLNISVGFVWGNFLFWYYMVLAWKNLPGIADRPKKHHIG